MMQKIETLGYFGLSSWEKILSAMRQYLKGNPSISYVSSFWKNEQLIKNLDNAYLSLMAQKRKPATPTGNKTDFYLTWDAETIKLAREISDRIAIPLIVVYAYFNSIYKLATTGKIPYAKYDPLKYAEMEAQKKTLPTEKTILDKLTTTTQEAGKTAGKIFIPLAVIAGLITTVYFYNQFKPYRRLS